MTDHKQTPKVQDHKAQDRDLSHPSRRDIVRQKSHEQTTVHGHAMEKGDVFKFAGLIAFVLISVVAVALCWPLLGTLFGEGGAAAVKEQILAAGPLGVCILLALQFLQVVVAFIPGEVVQVVAGLLYGPLWGTLIVLVGCICSSAVVYALVHKLGAPFVHNMIPEKYLDKLHHFEESQRLNFTVFVLFLIPGLPKDVFTYLVPLTSMPMREFVLLSNTARIPGIAVSTYAAYNLSEGNILSSVVVFAIAAAFALVGLTLGERILNALSARQHTK